MSRVKLYTSKDCRNCHRTADILDSKGIEFEAVDVDTLSEAETEELRAQGFRSLPVVITEDDAWCGFRPDKLVTLDARSYVVWSIDAGTHRRMFENTAALTRAEAEAIVARYAARGIRAGIEAA